MSKRKAYNPIERRKRLNRSLVQNHRVAVLYTYAPEQLSHLIDDVTGKRFKATPSIVNALLNTSYKWGIFIAVLCIDHTGEKYMRCEQIVSNQYYYKRELADFLHERHVDLIKTSNQAHFVNAVWLASPYGKDWLESEAAHLFDKFGAWNNE